MTKFRCSKLFRRLVFLHFLFWLLPASAQEPGPATLHWAYASYFGTGWYQVGDQRDVFVMRFTPRWKLREASFEDGERRIGYEFRLPVTAGLNTFSLDDPTGTLDPGNLGSLSITPGIDMTIPVNGRWELKPFASAGFGTILSENESAWTYWAGIKSKVSFERGNLDWALLNSIGYVGYSPKHGPSEDFWPLMIGFEFDHPLAKMQFAGEQAKLHWHAMYTTFKNDLDLVIENGSVAPITDQWEFGVSMGRENKRLKIWLFSFDRLGAAYRFSSNGEFKGISIVFRSIFDR